MRQKFKSLRKTILDRLQRGRMEAKNIRACVPSSVVAWYRCRNHKYDKVVWATSTTTPKPTKIAFTVETDTKKTIPENSCRLLWNQWVTFLGDAQHYTLSAKAAVKNVKKILRYYIKNDGTFNQHHVIESLLRLAGWACSSPNSPIRSTLPVLRRNFDPQWLQNTE